MCFIKKKLKMETNQKNTDNYFSKCSLFGCGKKLGLLPNLCRCDKAFCFKHRLPETHECKYDYKNNGKKQLNEENKCIIFNKILKI